MQIIPAELPVDGERFHGTESLDIEQVDGTVVVCAPHPVSFDIRAERTGSEVKLQGSLSAGLEVSCVRCLTAFAQNVTRDFEVIYRRAGEGAEGDETELDEMDLDLDYYGDEGINLQQLLGEQVLLSLPMKPLCRPECRGLCSQCGADLNLESCACSPEVDPRLASLEAIRDQL